MNFDNINNSLINTLKEISILNKSASSGNDIDKVIFQIICSNLSKLGFNPVSSEVWDLYYKSYKNNNLNSFKNLELYNSKKEIITGLPKDKLIIDKPYGSQKFPDILIINNFKSLSIEIKSSKEDNITWNSGLPQKNSIYIFHHSKLGKTTFFLGQDLINDIEFNILKEIDLNFKNESKLFNDKLFSINSDWYYYPRPMFVSKSKFFNSEKIKNQRESNVINFLNNLKWC